MIIGARELSLQGDENVLDVDSGLRCLHNLVNILKATGLYTFFLKIHFLKIEV